MIGVFKFNFAFKLQVKILNNLRKKQSVQLSVYLMQFLGKTASALNQYSKLRISEVKRYDSIMCTVNKRKLQKFNFSLILFINMMLLNFIYN